MGSFLYKFLYKQGKSGRKMKHLLICGSGDNFSKKILSEDISVNLNFVIYNLIYKNFLRKIERICYFSLKNLQFSKNRNTILDS